MFRGPHRPGWTATDVAESARNSLESLGFGEFQLADAEIAGRPGARLDCTRHDAGRIWAVREYFVISGTARFALGCGSSVPDEDDALFAAMADRFEVLD